MIIEPHQFSDEVDKHYTHARHVKWAETAWEQICSSSPDAFTEDHQLGFIDGFVDYLDYGGSGEPPPLPPRRYWRRDYQTPAGHAAAQQWFEGFRHGVSIARSSGYRDLVTIPVSDIIESPYVIPQIPGARPFPHTASTVPTAQPPVQYQTDPDAEEIPTPPQPLSPPPEPTPALPLPQSDEILTPDAATQGGTEPDAQRDPESRITSKPAALNKSIIDDSSRLQELLTAAARDPLTTDESPPKQPESPTNYLHEDAPQPPPEPTLEETTPEAEEPEITATYRHPLAAPWQTTPRPIPNTAQKPNTSPKRERGQQPTPPNSATPSPRAKPTPESVLVCPAQHPQPSPYPLNQKSKIENQKSPAASNTPAKIQTSPSPAAAAIPVRLPPQREPPTSQLIHDKEQTIPDPNSNNDTNLKIAPQVPLRLTAPQQAPMTPPKPKLGTWRPRTKRQPPTNPEWRKRKS